MKIKRDWQKRFADLINKELNAYKREDNNPNNLWIKVGVKDTIYLLGEAMNPNYKWANGFREFCKEIGIDFNLIER